jgi:LPS sulfotransferase NodH
VCGTPRTGSTYLCDLLASTGVAGYPASYFREPDQQDWARRWGVPVAGDGSFDYRSLVRGALRAGASANGVFAARVMWGTLELIVQGLAGPAPSRADVDVLSDAFGPLLFVHLRREDVVGQAVSWARAEQTGYWQPGDTAQASPHLDTGQVDELVRTIREHDAAWSAWFSRQRVQPHVVTYEDLIADPGRTVTAILDRLGVEAPAGWLPRSAHGRQADEVNREWVRRYRQALT